MSMLQKGLIVCLALAPIVSMAQASSRDLRAVQLQPEAWQIVMLANQARAEAGAGPLQTGPLQAGPLQWDPALAAAARQHCLRMAAEGPIAHRYGGEPDVAGRASQAGAHFSVIEENVAIGPSPAAIHSSWMHSPGHRANLLSPDVDRVGVAVVASRGVLYAVADYERSVPALTQTQVEASIAELLRGSGVDLTGDPSDARASCVQGSLAKTSRQPGFLMLWQGAELNRLPGALVDRISSGRYHRAAVGSCPPDVAENSFTAYRVAVLLY
jgi:uncharacterized protein YkwD